MLPVCAPEMEVQPHFKVDCPAKFRSCNSFITQLVNAPGMPILLPRCYICPSGSVNMTLWTKRSRPIGPPFLPTCHIRGVLMRMFKTGKPRGCAWCRQSVYVLWQRSVKRKRCVQGQSRLSIREEGKLIAAVNQEWDEEKSTLKIFHIDPSVNK